MHTCIHINILHICVCIHNYITYYEYQKEIVSTSTWSRGGTWQGGLPDEAAAELSHEG